MLPSEIRWTKAVQAGDASGGLPLGQSRRFTVEPCRIEGSATKAKVPQPPGLLPITAALSNVTAGPSAPQESQTARLIYHSHQIISSASAAQSDASQHLLGLLLLGLRTEPKMLQMVTSRLGQRLRLMCFSCKRGHLMPGWSSSRLFPQQHGASTCCIKLFKG